MNYQVKDIKLAGQGRLKMEWAEREMPVLAKLKAAFIKTQPFKIKASLKGFIEFYSKTRVILFHTYHFVAQGTARGGVFNTVAFFFADESRAQWRAM